MREITLHVSLTKIPTSYMEDESYDSTEAYIMSMLNALADGLQCCLWDVEIK